MSYPEWIDVDLSQQLPILRAKGEGQYLEFMEKYPDNGNELSREIAAFASTNPGTILIGIRDDGTLAGLSNLHTLEQRDALCRRIEGLCTGNVKPAITPTMKFAQEGSAVVLAIEVPRGKQPVYYSRYTPYVRHLSQSRPAEPHEVIERVADWSATTPFVRQEGNLSEQFLSEVSGQLIDAIIFGEQLDDRNVNPWLDQVLAQLQFDAKLLREYALDNRAIEMGLDSPLREIADKLDSAANHRLTMSSDSWQTLAGYVSDAVALARQFKTSHIDVVPLTSESKREIRELIKRSARQLTDLDSRANRMADDGRMEELQSEASRVGHALIAASYNQADQVADGLSTALHAIGKDLHLLETERMYIDGGQSMRRILDKLHDLAGRLNAFVLDFQI